MYTGPAPIPSKVPAAMAGVGRTVVVPPPPPPPPPPPVPPLASAGLASVTAAVSAATSVKSPLLTMCSDTSGLVSPACELPLQPLSRARGVPDHRTLVVRLRQPSD